MESIKHLKRSSENDDLSVKELLLNFFAGDYDQEIPYSAQTYRTQTEIAQGIAEATGGRYTPGQSAISKKLKLLLNRPYQLKGREFAIHLGENGYSRISPTQLREALRTNLLYHFEAEDIFYNNHTKPTEYMFRLNNPEWLPEVKKQLRAIFDGCLFRLATSNKKSAAADDLKIDQQNKKNKQDKVLISVKLCPLSNVYPVTVDNFHRALKEHYAKK